MNRFWSQFVRIFVGPVFLALASAFHGWTIFALLALGSFATLISFFQTQRILSTASERGAADGILRTAVEFLHANGIREVRANYMELDKDRETLRMKYESTAYGKFEVDNNWEIGDASCASKAIELKVPVLGGYPGEWELAKRGIAFPFRVEVTNMKILEREQIRSVLSFPVFRRRFGDPIGVLNFDDLLPLNESRLTDSAILSAIQDVASYWAEAVS